MSQTIDYRNPSHTTASGTDRIMACLQRREIFFTWKLVGAAVIGIFFSLLGPLTVAFLFYGLDRRANGADARPFYLYYCISLVIVIPLLFWLEARTRGNFVEDSIDSTGLDSSISSYGMWQVGGHILSWIFWIELCLIGPRLIMSAWLKHQAYHKVRTADRSRACEALYKLLSFESGIETAILLNPNEHPAGLRSGLLYLRHFGWIDFSKDRSRVWILSESRPLLEKIAR